MDVIQPQLIWIGNRCYRKTAVSSDSTEEYHEEKSEGAFCDMPKLSGSYEIDDVTDICEMDLPIKNLEDGRFRISMAIASEYFPRIIGKGGDTRKQLEKETRTQISIPHRGQTGDITITGYDRKGVISVYTQITLLVSTVRKHLSKTHFISVPLSSCDIKARFLEFQRDVLDLKLPGINNELFQAPDKLHITIGVLVLLNDGDRQKATSVLQSCQERMKKILGTKPLIIQVQGINIMNDDPEQVRVLYAQCLDESGRLQRIADAIVDEFEANGVLDRENDHVKLHATLMNTSFTLDSEDETNRQNRVFNAQPILEKFKNYLFGTQSVEVLHLSQRFTSSPSTGYYMATSQLSLLNNESLEI